MAKMFAGTSYKMNSKFGCKAHLVRKISVSDNPLHYKIRI